MSRGSESIKELRKICQESRYENEGGMPWFERIFFRRISIYFTKLLLKMGISANQATLISFFIGIIGGSFFVFGDPKYWVVGALLLYPCMVFDRVDGEIARYNNSASAAGEYWDGVCDIFLNSYRIACMTLGIYSLFHELSVLIFGYIAVASPLFSHISKLLAYKLELFSENFVNNDNIKTKKSKKQILFRYGSLIFNPHESIVLAILAVAMIDLYIPAVIIVIPLIGSFMINARYVYIILYGVAVLIVTIFRVHNVINKGTIPSF